jgi:hypothetical protein
MPEDLWRNPGVGENRRSGKRQVIESETGIPAVHFLFAQEEERR